MGDGTPPRAKVAFVYPNSRLQLAADVAAGTAADSFLLGQNHLAEFGYDAVIHEPRIRAVSEDGGLAHRVRWNVRESIVPWELGNADFVVTALFNLLPITARVRRRPRTVVLDFALATVLDRRSGPTRRILTTSLRSADAIVCLSEHQRQRLIERTDIPPERIHTVLLGIDHEFLHPSAGAPGDERVDVLAVGKDLARDYKTLAQAAASIDAKFVVVTEERNIRGIDLPPNLQVRRGLTYAELRDLYARARCVVLPLRRPDYPYGTESGGLTALMEAMAMGRPVVASNRPITDEYCRADESALIVPTEDSEGLAAAITRILSDDALAARLGAAARQQIEEHHTMRQFAQGLAALFEQMA